MTKIYVDTSVFGGVFDEEFKTYSVEFFNLLADGVNKMKKNSIVLK
jgi:hypothetical protein